MTLLIRRPTDVRPSEITPREKAARRSVIERPRATSASTGRLRERNSVTTGEPATAKRKQVATARTKAITWFFVSAEMAAPMAR